MCDISCPKDCTCLGLYFICKLRHAFWSFIPEPVVYLSLFYSSFGEIAVSFKSCRNLIFIDLSHTRLSTGQVCNVEGIFNKSSILHYLVLSHNSLSEIVFYCFSGLAKLTSLNLQGNFIHKVGAYSFQHFVSLTVLNLTRLSLEILDPLSFANISGIFVIDLSNNKLCSVSVNVFYLRNSLKLLILGGNRIKHIKIPEIYEYLLITSQPKICKCLLASNVHCVVFKVIDKWRSGDMHLDLDWLSFY